MVEKEKNPESEYITLKVLGLEEVVLEPVPQFKIKKHTPLRKLISAYCDRIGLGKEVLRFCFDGNTINGNDTPTSLDMDTGDTIQVFYQQPTGYYY